ncbi:PEPxxWA-CTERM sorting domain-containing protein [Sphingomonas flavalba]|uniref:Npun_F0296 family exosortase-dependent surface protein n=1 Tax=Sphingomonas flavalba TaxID=2559804 RepID=UPI0039E0982A
MKAYLLAAAAGLAVLAAPAMAGVTVTTHTNGVNPGVDVGYAGLGQTLLYDFDGASPTAGNLTGNYTIFAAPGTGESAAPAGTPAGEHYLSVPNPEQNGSADILLGGGYFSASFYWGSIDGYNTVEVLGANGNVIGTWTGSALPTPTNANGNQSDFTSNMRVNFTADGGDYITGFRLHSNGFAFETDTYAVGAAVPEPATWAMLLGGFGLIGGAMRRSRKTARTVLA